MNFLFDSSIYLKLFDQFRDEKNKSIVFVSISNFISNCIYGPRGCGWVPERIFSLISSNDLSNNKYKFYLNSNNLCSFMPTLPCKHYITI